MSFIRLGAYAFAYGSLNSRGGNSGYWSSAIYNFIYAHSLFFDPDVLNTQYSDVGAYGDPIRCVSR